MTKRLTEREKFLNRVIHWAAKADPKTVDRWLKYAKRYLEDNGWNEYAIDEWLEQGDGGFNFKPLHLEYTVKQFYDEVYYCSDRMSLIRLFRCHVMYRCLTDNPKDFGTAWNKRMKELGARKGTLRDLENI